MRKGYIVIFLLIFELIAISNPGYCKWRLINKTPPIEGGVTDATTGKPIENVVISCEWVKEVPAFVDRVRKGFAHEVVITDKEGRYRIPSKRSFHFPPILCVGSSFNGISINIAHPLYSTPQFVGDGNEWVFVPLENRRIYKSQDGIIHYDIELLSLEEKYVKAIESLESKVKRGEMSEEERKKAMGSLGSELFGVLSSYDNAAYWKNLREKNAKFDIEDTFVVWDKIGSYYPEDGNLQWLLPRVKNKIKEKMETRR